MEVCYGAVSTPSVTSLPLMHLLPQQFTKVNPLSAKMFAHPSHYPQIAQELFPPFQLSTNRTTTPAAQSQSNQDLGVSIATSWKAKSTDNVSRERERERERIQESMHYLAKSGNGLHLKKRKPGIRTIQGPKAANAKLKILFHPSGGLYHSFSTLHALKPRLIPSPSNNGAWHINPLTLNDPAFLSLLVCRIWGTY